MLNIVKSELYKFIHRPYIYVFNGVLLGITFLVFALFIFEGSTTKLYVIEKVSNLGIEAALFMLAFLGVLFGEEFKYGTIKNTVTSNVSRGKIYIAKFIGQGIMGTITFILIVLALIIGMCFLEGGEGYTSEIFRSFIIRILCVYPIFIGSLAIANFWVVLLKIDSMAQAMYIFSLALSEGIIANLGRRALSGVSILRRWLIIPQAYIVGNFNATNDMMIHVLWVGIFTVIFFTAISLLIFRRREV